MEVVIFDNLSIFFGGGVTAEFFVPAELFLKFIQLHWKK